MPPLLFSTLLLFLHVQLLLFSTLLLFLLVKTLLFSTLFNVVPLQFLQNSVLFFSAFTSGGGVEQWCQRLVVVKDNLELPAEGPTIKARTNTIEKDHRQKKSG